jgi:hypothetical protein
MAFGIFGKIGIMKMNTQQLGKLQAGSIVSFEGEKFVKLYPTDQFDGLDNSSYFVSLISGRIVHYSHLDGAEDRPRINYEFL